MSDDSSASSTDEEMDGASPPRPWEGPADKPGVTRLPSCPLQPCIESCTLFTDSKYPAIDLIDSLKLGGIIPGAAEGTRTRILLTGTLSIKGTSARVGTPSSEGDYVAGSARPADT